MGKITKADLKVQREIQDLIYSEKDLTEDEIEFVYQHYNPGMDDNITERGVFFTPIGLAQDFAVFAHKHNSIVDVCSGIGMLSYKCLNTDYYNCDITDITLIEYNPAFTNISRRLLTGITAFNSERKHRKLTFITANAFEQSLWSNLMKERNNKKYDTMISNPPYGTMPKEQQKNYTWLNYTGERELMVLELALRYSSSANFILPPGTCEFRYSGRPYYEEVEQRKVKRFREKNKESFFKMECDAIDTSIYKDDWKNTNITVEVADINFNRSDYC